jgi:hypothetical protein
VLSPLGDFIQTSVFLFYKKNKENFYILKIANVTYTPFEDLPIIFIKPICLEINLWF